MSLPTAILPTSYYGRVETTQDAIELVNAAYHNVIPTTMRRLNETERIPERLSGSVFIFNVKESRIQRWTDRFCWTPSAISGNFLVYKEMNQHCRVRKTRGSRSPREQTAEKELDLSPPTVKPNGLLKKTITIIIEGVDMHLICYLNDVDAKSGHLRTPSLSDAAPVDPYAFDFQTLRHPPKIAVARDGVARLVYDPEIGKKDMGWQGPRGCVTPSQPTPYIKRNRVIPVFGPSEFEQRPESHCEQQDIKSLVPHPVLCSLQTHSHDIHAKPHREIRATSLDDPSSAVLSPLSPFSWETLLGDAPSPMYGLSPSFGEARIARSSLSHALSYDDRREDRVNERLYL